MNTILRMGLATGLLCIAGFSVFGFLASFEPPQLLEMKVFYALTGLSSVAGIIATVFWGRGRTAIS